MTRPAKPQIKMELMYVTPAMATEWLKKLAPNRTLGEKRVSAIASDISAGRYVPTHQPIAFDLKDQLCDGQHRLSAIVAANCGLWLFVATHLSLDAMPVIDSGRTRTLGDRVTIAEGWEHGSRLISIARMMTEFELGSGRMASDQLIIKMAKREQEHIEWVVSKSAPRYTAYAPIATALAYARPIMEKGQPDLFADRLISGEMLKHGSPILALRHHIERSNAGKRNGLERSADLRKTLLALKLFAHGEERQLLHDNTIGVSWVMRARQERGLPTQIE